MFDAKLISEAERLLALMRGRALKLATAESCTGGLIAGLFTEVAGASDVFERGFVTYSNAAKVGALNVDYDMLQTFGAVSAETAAAMAAGALRASAADIALSVTGIAGPSGGTAEKPVGLVYLGLAVRGRPVLTRELRLGDAGGRAAVRMGTVDAAVVLLGEALAE